MSRTKPATKSDAQIQQEVLRELKWDSRVEETEIGVIVDDGIVTLTGNVGSYAKKLAALEATHRVVGVLDIADEIKVVVLGSRPRSDTEIAQAVRHALEWDAMVKDDRIRSTVSNGWVFLEGTAESLYEREDVERAVRRLAGVRGVTDQIIVTGPTINSGVVQKLIEEALERRADRIAHHIKVSVSDGDVRLEGRVRSWAEKRAVLGVVSHAPGIKAVTDGLMIDPLI